MSSAANRQTPPTLKNPFSLAGLGMGVSTRLVRVLARRSSSGTAILRAWLTATAGFALLLAPPVQAQPPTGLQPDAVFQTYSPLSENTELLRRMLSPLADHVVEQALARSNKTLAAQSVYLSAERFTVYVPPQAPPGGYGVLVFIPPGPEAKLPPGWAPVLNQQGVIYVSAARSGNEADVLGRRVPLALLALENIRRLYSLDPERI
jgi:hypothetical protein